MRGKEEILANPAMIRSWLVDKAADSDMVALCEAYLSLLDEVDSITDDKSEELRALEADLSEMENEKDGLEKELEKAEEEIEKLEAKIAELEAGDD